MNATFTKVHDEIQRGMKLKKCRKCGCMRGTLQNLQASLPSLKMNDAKKLLDHVNTWLEALEPQEYPCFGCKYCIPPEAMTMLTRKYPSLASSTLSSCEFEVTDDSWPAVDGEFTVLNRSAPVAVSTLGSIHVEEKLVKLNPPGLCLAGKTETENIGIDKVVKNVITNPAIRYLIIAGKDPDGHRSGETLFALWQNGVDEDMRVIGSRARRPILKNVSLPDISAFRNQIQMEDMIGCENSRSIAKKIRELAGNITPAMSASSCGCASDCCDVPATQTVPLLKPITRVPKLKAKKYNKAVKLDKAGYFVIMPSRKTKTILVEHYSYDNKLLRSIEGDRGRDIYFTIINNGWVTELSHAAYLGKELARAELSIAKGFKFTQDAA